jgi:hypothetical protein
VQLDKVEQVERSSWQQDIGSGTDIGWYNDNITSRRVLEGVRAISVSEAAADRINVMVTDYLSR